MKGFKLIKRILAFSMALIMLALTGCVITPTENNGSTDSSDAPSSESESETTDTLPPDNGNDGEEGNGDGEDGGDGEDDTLYDSTKYFPITQDDEVCDYYVINSSGEAVEANGFGCTSYLSLDGADTINVSMAQSLTSGGLAFYDADKQFISYVASPTGAAQKKMVERSVPANAVYFRTSYFDYASRKTHGDFSYELKKDGQVIDQGATKRAYQDGYIFFSRKVSQTLDTTDTTDLEVTTGVLALPDNYSATGEQTKLIIYFHGYSHYVYYGHWGNTDNFRKQKDYFLSRGYAVLDCNGARDNYKRGQFTSAGSSQYVDGYYQCYKYAIEHYNLDTQAYVIGGSAGGPAGINYVRWHQPEVKALQLLSPWTDLKECSWGQGIRDTFVEYLGFNNKSTYEKDKAAPYDPQNMIVDGVLTEITVPIYGIMGSKESGHCAYPLFVKWMNAAIAANPNNKVTIWQGKEHSQVVSGADPDTDPAVCDFFDSIQ